MQLLTNEIILSVSPVLPMCFPWIAMGLWLSTCTLVQLLGTGCCSSASLGTAVQAPGCPRPCCPIPSSHFCSAWVLGSQIFWASIPRRQMQTGPALRQGKWHARGRQRLFETGMFCIHFIPSAFRSLQMPLYQGSNLKQPWVVSLLARSQQPLNMEEHMFLHPWAEEEIYPRIKFALHSLSPVLYFIWGFACWFVCFFFSPSRTKCLMSSLSIQASWSFRSFCVQCI